MLLTGDVSRRASLPDVKRHQRGLDTCDIVVLECLASVYVNTF